MRIHCGKTQCVQFVRPVQDDVSLLRTFYVGVDWIGSR